MSKLESEELVSHVGQTGFTVSQLSKSELKSLIETTILIESIAIELSIKNYTFDWEEDLVLGFHRLKRTSRTIAIENTKKMAHLVRGGGALARRRLPGHGAALRASPA